MVVRPFVGRTLPYRRFRVVGVSAPLFVVMGRPHAYWVSVEPTRALSALRRTFDPRRCLSSVLLTGRIPRTYTSKSKVCAMPGRLRESGMARLERTERRLLLWRRHLLQVFGVSHEIVGFGLARSERLPAGNEFLELCAWLLLWAVSISSIIFFAHPTRAFAARRLHRLEVNDRLPTLFTALSLVENSRVE